MSSTAFGQSKTALRILVVDPHSMYRAGLRAMIMERMPDAELLETGDLSDGLSKIRSAEPVHLVLIDLDLSTFRMTTLLKQAFDHSPRTRFAVISALDTRRCILNSLAVGFHGFISKHQFDDEILNAIRDIVSGRIYVPPSLALGEDVDATDGLGAEAPSGPLINDSADLIRLTARQREVLSHLALGKSNKEIARALHIAEATTKVHAAALLRAFGARNRTEAAFKAGTLLKSLDGGPQSDLRRAEAESVLEDGRTLPLRLIKAKPAVATLGPGRRRKPQLE